MIQQVQPLPVRLRQTAKTPDDLVIGFQGMSKLTASRETTGHRHTRACGGLLEWIGSRPRTGRRSRAFFATLYYTGLRPEEAVALRVADAALPERGRGELVVHTSEPEIGSRRTDDGQVHESRHLKGREPGETRRPIPVHPALVKILHELIEEDGLNPGDLFFPGEHGGILAGSVFRRAWAKARKAVLPPHEYASPVGKRVYDLRHTCLTSWLNAGVPLAQVAEWAGNSVPVLLATYARCVSGHHDALRRRMETVQKLPVPRSPGRGRARLGLWHVFGTDPRRRLSTAGLTRTAGAIWKGGFRGERHPAQALDLHKRTKSGRCPRQGTTQKDAGRDLGGLVGRLVVTGSFVPASPKDGRW